jgi:hypothetical protein
MKKIIMLLMCVSILMGSGLISFADVDTEVSRVIERHNFDYTMKEYESVLPFKLSTEDYKVAEKLFNEIGKAFEKNNLNQAHEKMEGFYKVMSKYWLSETTLKTLLPFEDMMKFGGKILLDEQKLALNESYNLLKDLKEKNDLQGYFAQIRKIHSDYYLAIGKSVGDTNDELRLVQYIKGADKLTAKDLKNYTYNDYLQILPFHISDQDYTKGQHLFDEIIKALKNENMEGAKKLTGKLNDLLAPYWISDDALNMLVPHEDYQEKAIQFFPRKDQLVMNDAFEAIKKAQEEKNYDAYFKAIDTYFDEFAFGIQAFYVDYFDEIVFIQS